MPSWAMWLLFGLLAWIATAAFLVTMIALVSGYLGPPERPRRGFFELDDWDVSQGDPS
jgi:hypothetical protein